MSVNTLEVHHVIVGRAYPIPRIKYPNNRLIGRPILFGEITFIYFHWSVVSTRFLGQVKLKINIISKVKYHEFN